MSLLNNIQCICQEKGIAISFVEKEAGYTPKAIYRITPNTSALKLCKVAKLLGTTVEELLEDENA